LDEGIAIGPIINKKGYDKILHHIQDAEKLGAKVLAGAKYNGDEDKDVYFIEPTVIANVTEEMLIMHEETFGPVAPVTSFRTLDEAVGIANDTPFGLAAYFFTDNYRTGQYLFENLDYGIIGWNDGGHSAAHAPFGGLKQSSLGREGGSEGIEPYLETKYLSIGDYHV